MHGSINEEEMQDVHVSDILVLLGSMPGLAVCSEVAASYNDADSLLVLFDTVLLWHCPGLDKV